MDIRKKTLHWVASKRCPDRPLLTIDVAVDCQEQVQRPLGWVRVRGTFQQRRGRGRGELLEHDHAPDHDEGACVAQQR